MHHSSRLVPAQQRQRARAALVKHADGAAQDLIDANIDTGAVDVHHFNSLPMDEFEAQCAMINRESASLSSSDDAIDFFSRGTTSWVVDDSNRVPVSPRAEEEYTRSTWRAVASAKHIEDLTITRRPLDTAARTMCFICTAWLPCPSPIQHLAVPFTDLTDESFVVLACAIRKSRKSLTVLDVSNNKLTARSIDVCRALLESVPTLAHLRLRGNDFSHDVGAIVELIQDNPELRSLDVGFCRLPSQVAEAALSTLPTSSLVYANFDAAHISVNFAMNLADNLASNFTLLRLSLHHTSTSASRAFKDRIARMEKRNAQLWNDKSQSESTLLGSITSSPFLVLEAVHAEEKEAQDIIMSDSISIAASPSALPPGYAAYRVQEPSRLKKSKP